MFNADLVYAPAKCYNSIVLSVISTMQFNDKQMTPKDGSNNIFLFLHP